MSNKPWYKKNLSRLLVDMHIPDWNDAFLADFSVEKYAQMMKLSGIAAAIPRVRTKSIQLPARARFPKI